MSCGNNGSSVVGTERLNDDVLTPGYTMAFSGLDLSKFLYAFQPPLQLRSFRLLTKCSTTVALSSSEGGM